MFHSDNDDSNSHNSRFTATVVKHGVSMKLTDPLGNFSSHSGIPISHSLPKHPDALNNFLRNRAVDYGAICCSSERLYLCICLVMLLL